MSAVISIPLATQPDPLSDAASHAEQDRQRVLLTRDGRPVAAVVPIEDLETLQALEVQEDAHWSDVAEQAIANWEAEGRPPGMSHQELLARYGIGTDEK